MSTKRKALSLSIIIFTFLFLLSLTSSALELPEGLQKIAESNKMQAENMLSTVSFPLVFIAGILTLLSPCILPTVPAFFALSFKEKDKIAKKTFIFFLGFAAVFISFGLIGAAVGESLGSLQINYSSVILVAGLFLIFLGVLSFFGKGLDSIWHPKWGRGRRDSLGIFLFGLSFGLGWTACLGPVLAGIILIASVMGNYFYSGLLLLVYAFGLFVPLFLLALFFDKSQKIKRWIQGRELKLEIGQTVLITNTVHMLSGLLLMAIGFIFVIYKGTGIFNSWNYFGLKDYYYSWQDKILTLDISNWWLLAAVVLIMLIIWKRDYFKKNR